MEVRNLTYKNRLKNINYTFTDKKIYGIIGNRENITLLFELIAGLTKLKSGTIKDNNHTFMLFSDSDIQLFNDTVKEEVLYGTNKEVDLENIFTRLELEDIYELNPLSLSENDKKKVVFASMLAYDPDIILIDNFFNKIDYKTKKIFIDILKRLQYDEHKIIIVADQNNDLLYELVDEVIVLDDEIVTSGNKNDVYHKKEEFSDLELEIPSHIEFVNYVAVNKNIDLPYRDRVTDIVKDVFDNVQQ